VVEVPPRDVCSPLRPTAVVLSAMPLRIAVKKAVHVMVMLLFFVSVWCLFVTPMLVMTLQGKMDGVRIGDIALL